MPGLMKNSYFVYLLIFAFTFSVYSAERIWLCGYTSSGGQYFTYGSGYDAADNYLFRNPSMVADNYSVIFPAPEPEYSAVASSGFYFSVFQNIFAADLPYLSSQSRIFDGFVISPVSVDIFRRSNWHSVADSEHLHCLTIREEVFGSSLPSLYVRYNRLDETFHENPPGYEIKDAGLIAKNVKLAINSAGTLAVTYGGNSKLRLFKINENGLSLPKNLQDEAVNFYKNRRDNWVQLSFDDSDRLALSDDDNLFFAEKGGSTLAQLANLPSNQRGIFVLNLNSKLLRYIGPAGAASSHSAQLSISANGETLIFNRSPQWLKIARAENSYSVNVAESNLNLGTGVKFNSPSISANGRYIVFQSDSASLTAESNGTEQIYRYDIQKEKFLLVSSLNGELANSPCYSPAISPNGSLVTFVSAATNFLPNNAGQRQVFLAELEEDEEPDEEKLVDICTDELLIEGSLTWETVDQYGILALEGSAEGRWLDKNGNKLTSLNNLQPKDFPLCFSANEDIFNRSKVYLLSDEYRYEFTVLHSAMKKDFSFKKGWQIMAFPFIAKENDIAELLQQCTVFSWDTKNSRFIRQSIYDYTLLKEPGTGFFVYSDKELLLTIEGNRAKAEDIPPFTEGWQLKGNVGDGEKIVDFSNALFFEKSAEGTFILPKKNSKPETPTANWMFQ